MSKAIVIIIYFRLLSISQAQPHNTKAQKWLATAHYRIGACRPVATGGHLGAVPPEIYFVPPQILLCPEKFVLNV